MDIDRIVVRGGGDIASGTIQKLFRSGFRVLVLETDYPTSIRRNVSFSEAIYDGKTTVEGITAISVKSIEEIEAAWDSDVIPVVIDKEGKLINIVKPLAVVDAILAKKNLGTTINMAPITIALGPGFEAGVDVDVVIETMRGHDLGRLIFSGYAMKNTGYPGLIGGYTNERVIYSPLEGELHNIKSIGDIVEEGEIIAVIENTSIRAEIKGLLRGLLRDKSKVTKGLKIADIDPRIEEIENYNTISDKARCIGGGVLEAILLKKQEIYRNKP